MRSSLRNSKLLALFNFLLDFRLYGPVLVIYFAKVTGSYASATALLAVTMMSAAALELPTGFLSDRWGRVRVATSGAIASTAAVGLYALAENYSALIVGAVLEGLARALISGNNQALLYDSLAEHGREADYHRHAGKVGSMFQLALAISALAGGLVAEWSLRAAVALSVVPQAGCIVVTMFMVEPRTHRAVDTRAFEHVRSAFRKMRRNRQLRRMVVAGSIQHGVGETAFQLQPAFIALLWPTWAIGLARTINNGLAFVSFVMAGRVIDRFGATKTLLCGQVWANAANLVAVVKPTVVSPAIIASESMTFGTSTVAQETLQQNEFSSAERATMASLGSLLSSFVFGLVVLAAGVLADRYGLRTTLLACQAVGIATLPLVWAVHVHATRRP